MPSLVRLDIFHDATTHRVGLRLGSDESGAHTLIITPDQAREVAASIANSANLAEGLLALSGGIECKPLN